MEFARLFDGRKYMWDGKDYDSEDEQRTQEQHYRLLGFEVRSVAVDNKRYLFTRRAVASAQK